jgi:RNA polymerase sigma-54 factor
MALSTKLMMRQGQSLVMTPQLLQAIKLLQFSNIELAAYVEEELERNPLLERADDAPADPFEATPAHSDSHDTDYDGGSYESGGLDAASFDSGDDGSAFTDARSEGDWSRDEFETDRGALESSLGTEIENNFDVDRASTPLEGSADTAMQLGLSATSWSGATGTQAFDDEPHNLEAYVAAHVSLADHLGEQLAVSVNDPIDRLIGQAIIDSINESGYLSDDIEAIADRLGAPLARAEKMLSLIQTFDPSGVGARDLAECLAIQLRERDRYDPAMQILVAHLPLLARRDFANLRRLCGVDDEDMADMAAELRQLNPKPGRAFGGEAVQPVIPDVTVRAHHDGSWYVELNPEGLPRVLVNHTYAAQVSRAAGTNVDKNFISTCLQTANWLTKSLEQRARTILKVATEIVRQQDAFFAHGVEHLRPLNLKTVADAIGMHESTVSRVTSNKYMASPRGLFELKYFFTASIPAHGGGESHSAEAVRFRIKQLIDAESPDNVLSDDAIVVRLKESKVDIARRTVAKYRESLRIPSSVERRREKQALARASN